MPALLLAASLFSSSLFLAAGYWKSDDAATLLLFKDSFSAPPSSPLSAWDPARSSHCRWFGVSCDASSGRVVALNLTTGSAPGSPAAISGPLPDMVANLTQLRVLSLGFNAFSGQLPAAIGRLRRLEVLDLRGNNFSGGIPEEVTLLTSLVIIDLAYNSFSGHIPSGLLGLSGVRTADLSHNLLSGEITVDRRSRCLSLKHLALSSNLLVGRIPPEIGNCSRLRRLLLDENVLEGGIPAEIGRLSELRVLDVSRNSLTDRIPAEIGACRKLQALVLTNLASVEFTSFGRSSVPRVEFNSFVGGMPWEVFAVPSLELLWAPRANLDGRLPDRWGGSCRLRVLNLGQNYRISGGIPQGLGACGNLTFLDLSSNGLEGEVPSSLGVKCMVYLNVSRNFLSGSLPEFVAGSGCGEVGGGVVEKDNVSDGVYFSDLVSSAWVIAPFASLFDENFDVLHDFSWNGFVGSLPSFSFGDGFVGTDIKVSYGLLLNNNQFNSSLSDYKFLGCGVVENVAVNLSANLIQGGLPTGGPLFGCLQLSGFEAADNQLVGSIPLDIGDLAMLSHLDLGGNRLNGSIPDSLGGLKSLKRIFLGRNSLTGKIPSQLGQMTSLVAMDLSSNNLTGQIPPSLASASNLETLLLNHNKLSGEIPSSFSNLTKLAKLDVSFNNLSGSIPHLTLMNPCDYFRGNVFLQPCTSPSGPSPDRLPVPVGVSGWVGQRGKLKPFAIAMVVVASLILLVTVVLVVFYACGRRRKYNRQGSIKRFFVVTFADVPQEVNYENVLRSTEQFSIKYLIGTGGFGSTYKAELTPGYMAAVKRLSIGKAQGLQQFDAEIRTLGRIRHRNLVTLLGYYMGEAETFLIYNYLSGGNLETFIHDKSYKNTKWSTIHKIALDVAQALAYLHDSCVPRIVHRDIKPSNILLDENLNAYLSDFGLARLLEVSQTHATTDVIGTFGYVAPEYATTCRVTDKSDVYSFGVVLFELMSGKKSFDPSFSNYGHGFNIVAWGKMLIQEERFSELLRSELWAAGPKEKLVRMLKLASDCTVESLLIRPSMKHVVDKLKLLRG